MSEGKISKKVKQGKIDIDVEQCALVVHFEVESVRVDGNGRPIEVVDRSAETRKIKMISLSEDKNLGQMSEDIVEKCKYIHPSRVEEVEQQLIKLQKATLERNKTLAVQQEKQAKEAKDSSSSGGGAIDDKKREKGEKKKKERDDSDQPDTSAGGKSTSKGSDLKHDDDKLNKYIAEELEIDRQDRIRSLKDEDLPASRMSDLDDYMDMLYHVSGKTERDKEEGLKNQIRGVGMILNLCKDVMNLEKLIQNSTLMGALTRVLSDDHKRSIDLSFNILRVFLSFSNFVEMHSLIANYKIGALTMKVIEYEIKRTEHRNEERKEFDDKLDAELAREKESGDKSAIAACVDRNKRLKAKEIVKGRRIQRKQDKLLFVGFYILINLAEDAGIEKKMVKKDLLNYLCSMLDHGYCDVLLLSVTFLKKLSIFEENKEFLKNANIVQKCMKFLPCSSAPLVNAILRLLFNLSFDKGIREQMIKIGLIPKMIELLRVAEFRGKTLKVLYHLSSDERCRSFVTYTDGMQVLMGMVVNFPKPMLTKELAAVVVNLSLHPRNAEAIINSKGINYLMDRLSSNADPLLLKIIRNLSMFTFTQQSECASPEMQYRFRGLWSPHFKVLLNLLQDKEHDILIEVIGCLANFTYLDLPANTSWARFMKDYNLLSMINKLLVPGMAQNDVILEVVMLIGNMASDPHVCDVFASSNVINALYQVWKEHEDDVEIRLQLVHAFYKLMLVDASREEAMYSTRIVVDVIECLSSKNDALRTVASKLCEIVLERDRNPSGDLGQLGTQIRKKRFEGFNSVWISNVCQNSNDSIGDFDGVAEGNWGLGGRGGPIDDDDDLVSLGAHGMYRMDGDGPKNYGGGGGGGGGGGQSKGIPYDANRGYGGHPYAEPRGTFSSDFDNQQQGRYRDGKDSPSDKEESWDGEE